MVQLTISRNLLSTINIYNDLPSTTPKDHISLENTASIDHHVVHRVCSALLGNNAVQISSGGDAAKKFKLSSLLKGCSVYIPPKPPKPEPTPEFRALMARLRAEAEAEEYATLTNKPRANSPNVEYKNDEYTYEDLKRHMSIIANILLSTVATSAAVWMVASSWDVAERLALAFTCSLVVCVAEVVIFGGYLRRIDDSKQQEKKRAEKEEKLVINTWELGSRQEKKIDGVRKRKG